MDWPGVALAAAGIIGSSVAVGHGVVVQRLMVKPLVELYAHGRPVSGPVRRLVPPLLHFSTAVWFLGGLALIAAALWFGPAAKVTTGLLVGTTFLLGAVGNFWGNRGRHPGWAGMAVAIVLILVGISGGGGQGG